MSRVIIYFKNIEDARMQLVALDSNSIVTLVNYPLLARSLGIFAIDYIMRTLAAEFSFIADYIINCNKDLATRITAQKLGYRTTH